VTLTGLLNVLRLLLRVAGCTNYNNMCVEGSKVSSRRSSRKMDGAAARSAAVHELVTRRLAVSTQQQPQQQQACIGLPGGATQVFKPAIGFIPEGLF
jgi:hypothetical protein